MLSNKTREADTDIANMADVADVADSDRKRDWINLAQLELAADATLSNKMLYKPALRFHGLTGGLWGPAIGPLSTAASDSRPPSYHVQDPNAAGSSSDAGSTYAQSSLGNRTNPAKSPLSLRRRNTISVVLAAFALLAVAASSVGVVLYFTNPDGMLRANVRFIVANRNFTDNMHNTSSTDFVNLAQPLCSEMDRYFLTSGLSHFYMRCDTVSVKPSSTQTGAAVHLALDFQDNSFSHDAERIKSVILQKSGRQRSDSTLYLVMQDLLIYLRSLHVQLEVVPLDEEFTPRIPWRNDVDFIDRIMQSTNFSDIGGMKEVLTALVNSVFNMTSKLNTMQGAIDYINTTFHEQNKPIQILVDTLQNITVSLDNLNNNLRDINNTLKQFKTFLKGLNSNLFQIDDIINYLDDSISNLDNSALFLNSSIFDVNGTIKGMTGTLINVDRSLKYINQSVIDVNGTSLFTDQALDSMNKTLRSLDESIAKINWEVDHVKGGLNGINISLNTINRTVQNSYNRLEKLHVKLSTINETVYAINSRVQILTETYNRINDTLALNNESLNFVNGTVLEVLGELAGMINTMGNLTHVIQDTDGNLVRMNDSLSAYLQWVNEMVNTLSKFNTAEQQKTTANQIGLKDGKLLATINLLLNLNSTLFSTEHNVHIINDNLDNTEDKLNNLAFTLQQLGQTLDNINSTFEGLNDTLKLMNITVNNVSVSLDAMNVTLNDVGGSSVELEATFTAMKQTLDKANDSVIDIFKTVRNSNQTINHIGATLENVNDKSEYLQQRAMSLQQNISNLTGTLPELSDKLYNVNQSMELIKGKSNIITDSFNLIQTTMDSVNRTILSLATKLQETNYTLDKVNDLFAFANSSILWMEDSFQQLNNSIGELGDSFSLMKASFTGMDNAFPNMETELLLMNATIYILDETIQNGTIHLAENIRKRDSSLKRYSQVANAFRDASKYTRMLQNELELMKQDATETNLTVASLASEVSIANEQLAAVTKKFNFINTVFPPMKEKYIYLNEESAETNKSVRMINEVLNNTIKSMEQYSSQMVYFPNLRVPIKSMEAELNDVQISFQHNIATYLNRSDTFNESHNLFTDSEQTQWDLNETIDSIIETYEGVNSTLIEFESAINTASNSANITDAFLKNIKSTLQSMNETMEHITTINKMNNETDKTANVLKIVIKEAARYLTDFLPRLELADIKLENLTHQYGRILGSYNATDTYNVINESIYSLTDKLTYLNNSLQSVKDAFSKTVSNYTKIRMVYSGADIDLSEKSKDIMDDMTNANIKANSSFNDFHETLDILFDIMTDTNSSLNYTEDRLHRLEETVSKHAYVGSHQPVLEERFDITTMSFNNISDIISNTTGLIHQLFVTAEIINNRIAPMSNINISIEGQLEQLADHIKHLEIMSQWLNDSKQELELNYTFFKSLNTTYLSTPTIRHHYNMYQQGIVSMRTALENVNKELTDTNKNVISIQEHFAYIISTIDTYEHIEEDVDRVDLLIKYMNKSVTNLNNSYNTGIYSLNRIQAQLEAIKNNYTNLTTTTVDFNNSYVHDAIDEIVNILSDLMIPVNNVYRRANYTSKSFINVSDVLRNTVLDETNIQSVMSNVSSTLQTLAETTTAIEDDIKTVLSKINDIELSLVDINTTIHITNTTLFIDRQKQLLANRKFSSLLDKQQHVNETIKEAIAMIKESHANLTGVVELFDYINHIINSGPTLNISMDNSERMLHSMNTTITDLKDNIAHIETLLKTSDGILWTDTWERYSKNETVNDIKERYKKANHVFDELSKTLNDIYTSIHFVNDNNTFIASTLFNFNSSIHSFIDSRTRTSDMIKKVQDIKNESTKAVANMESIRTDIDTFKSNIKRIKQKYSNINDTVLNYYITPFNTLFNKTSHMYTDSSVSLAGTLERIHDLEDILRNLNATINSVVNTPDELHGVIASEMHVYNVFNGIMSNVTDDLEISSQNITSMSKSLEDLESILDNITDIFKQKEKNDYFDEHYQTLLSKYSDINQTILKIRDNSRYVHDNIGEIASSMFDVKQRMKRINTVNISTSDLETNLTSSNTMLTENEALLDTLSEILHKSKTLFSASDGLTIGDNETFVQLKTRYRELNKTLLQLDKDLVAINSSFQQTSTSLDNIDGGINGINISLNELHKINDTMTNLTLEMFNIQEGLNSTEHKTNSLNVSLNELKEFTKRLENHFRNVQTPTINSTWSNVLNGIADISSLIRVLETNISVMAESYNDDLEVLSNATRLLNTTFNASNEINDTLEKVRPDLKRLRNNIAAVNANLTHDTTSIVEISNAFENVTDWMEKLHQLLIHTEKNNFVNDNAPILRGMYKNVSRLLSEINENVNAFHVHINHSQSQLDIANTMINQEGSINISLTDITEVINAKIADTELISNIVEGINDSFILIDNTVINTNAHSFAENHMLDTIKETYQNMSDALTDMHNTVNKLNSEMIETSEIILNNDDISLNITNAVYAYQQLQENINATDTLWLKTRRGLMNANENINQIQHVDDNISLMIQDMKDRFANLKNTSLHNRLEIISNESGDVGTQLSHVRQEINLIQQISNQTSISLDGTHNSTEGVFDTLMELNTAINFNVINLLEINDNISEINSSLLSHIPSVLALNNKTTYLLRSVNYLKKAFLEQEKKEYIEKASSKIFPMYNYTQKLLDETLDYMIVFNKSMNDSNNLVYNILARIHDTPHVNMSIEDELALLEKTGDVLQSADKAITVLTSAFSKIDTDLMTQNSSMFNTNDTIDDIQNMYEQLNDTIQYVNANLTGLQAAIEIALSDLTKNDRVINNISDKLNFVNDNAPILRGMYKNVSRLLSEINENVNAFHVHINHSQSQLDIANTMINQEGSINISLTDITEVINANIADTELISNIVEGINDSFILIDNTVINTNAHSFAENHMLDTIKETYQNMSDALTDMHNTVNKLNSEMIETSEIILNNDDIILNITNAVYAYQQLQENINATDTLRLKTRRGLMNANENINEIQHVGDNISLMIQDMKDRFANLKNTSLHNRLEIISNESGDVGTQLSHVRQEINLIQQISNQTSISLDGTHNSTEGVFDTLMELNTAINLNVINLLEINDNISEINSSLLSHIQSVLALNNKTTYLLRSVNYLKKAFLEQEKKEYIEKASSKIFPMYNYTQKLLDETLDYMTVFNKSMNDSNNLAYNILARIHDTPHVNMSIEDELALLEKTGDVLQSADKVITALTSAFSKIDTDLMTQNSSMFNTNDTIDDIQNMYEQLNDTIQYVNANLTGLQAAIEIALSDLTKNDRVINNISDKLNFVNDNAPILRGMYKNVSRLLSEINKNVNAFHVHINHSQSQLDIANTMINQEGSINISLTDITEVINAKIADTELISNIVEGINDSFILIDNTVINTNAHSFAENHMLDTIKETYQNMSDALTDMHNTVNKLNSKMIETSEIILNNDDIILNITNVVYAYQQLQENINATDTLWLKTRRGLMNANENINQIQHVDDNISLMIQDMKDRFANLKNTSLHNRLEIISNESGDVGTQLSHVRQEINLIQQISNQTSISLDGTHNSTEGVFDTLMELNTAINFNVINLLEINDNISEINSSLLSHIPSVLALNNKTTYLLRSVNYLKKAFLEQEKKEYIEKASSKIFPMYNYTQKLLDETLDYMIVFNKSMIDSNNLVYNILARIHDTPHVNMSIEDELALLEKTGDVLQSADKAITVLTSAFSKIDTDLMTQNSSMFNTNDTIDDIQNMYEQLNDTIQYVNANLTGLQAAIEIALSDLTKNDRVINNISDKLNFVNDNAPILRGMYKNVSRLLSEINENVNAFHVYINHSQSQLDIANTMINQEGSINISLTDITEVINAKIADTELVSNIVEGINDSFILIDNTVINTNAHSFAENHMLDTIKETYQNMSDALTDMHNTVNKLNTEMIETSEIILNNDDIILNITNAVYAYQQLQENINATDTLRLKTRIGLMNANENINQIQHVDDNISLMIQDMKDRFANLKNTSLHNRLEIISNESGDVGTQLSHVRQEINLIQQISNQTSISLDGTHNSTEGVFDTLMELNTAINFNVINLLEINDNISEINSSLLSHIPSVLALNNKTTYLLRSVNYLKKAFLEQEKKEYIEKASSKIFPMYNYTQKLLDETLDYMIVFNKSMNDSNNLVYNILARIHDTPHVNMSIEDELALLEKTGDVLQSADKAISVLTGAFSKIDTDLMTQNSSMFNTNDTIDDIQNMYEQLNDTIQYVNANLTGLQAAIEIALSDLTKNDRVINNISDKLNFVNDNAPILRGMYKNVSRLLSEINENVNAFHVHINHSQSQLDIANTMINQEGSINISLTDITEVINAKIADTELISNIVEGINDSFILIDNTVINTNAHSFAENHMLDTIKETYQNMSDALTDMHNTVNKLNSDMIETSEIILNNDDIILNITNAVYAYQQLQENINATDTLRLKTRRGLMNANENINQIQHVDDNISLMIQDMKDRFANLKNTSLHNRLEIISNESGDVGTQLSHVRQEINLIQQISNQTSISLDGTHNSMEGVFDTLMELNTAINLNVINLLEINDNISEINSSLLSHIPSVLALNNKTTYLLRSVNYLKKAFLEQEKKEYIEKASSKIFPMYNYTQKLLDETLDYMIVFNKSMNDSNNLAYNILARIHDTPHVNMSIEDELALLEKTRDFLQSADKAITVLTSAFSKIDTDLMTQNSSMFNTNDTIDDIQNMYEQLNDTIQYVNANLTRLQTAIEIALSDLTENDRVIINISDKLKELDVLVVNASEVGTQLSVLDDRLQNFRNSSIKVNNKLKEIDSVIFNMNRKYRNVSNTGMQYDLRTMNANLHAYKEQYDNFLNRLSGYTTNMTHLKTSNSLLNNILTNTSKTDGQLQNKIQNALHVYEPLLEHIEALQKYLTNSSNELQVINQTFDKTTEAVNELEAKLVQQQIVDYIKQTFPDVLEQYILINETIATYVKDIYQASSTLRELVKNAVAVNDTIEAHTDIFISIDEIDKGIHSMATRLQNITEIHEAMEMLFQELGNQISNSFDDNDTLHDISTRFEQYNNTMSSILSEYNRLNLPLNGIQTRASTYNNILTNYSNEINEYDEVTNLLRNINYNITKSNISLEDGIRGSEIVLSMLTRTMKDMDEIKNVYDTVNSSLLHIEKDSVSQSLMDENSSFDTKLNRLKTLNDTFSEILHQRKEMADVVFKAIPTYEDLQKINKHAHKIGDSLSDAINSFNYKMELLHNEIADHTNVSYQLRSDVDGLERDFRNKRKNDFIDNNLPRINDAYLTLKEKLNNTSVVLLASETALQDLNASINNLSTSIDSLPTVNISLNEFEEGVLILKGTLDKMSDNFKYASKIFSDMDMSIVNNPYMRNETLAFVADVFNNTMGTLTEIESDLSTINRNTSLVMETLSMLDNEQHNISNIVQEFIITTSEYKDVNNTYVKLNTNLSHTGDLLDNITEIILSQQSVFEDMISMYKNTSNTDIQLIVSKFSNLIDYVAVRNPLVGKLYSNRLLHQYLLAGKTLYDAHELLNSTHSIADVLNVTLADITDKLTNVSQEAKEMSNTLFHYQDEGIQLHNTLGETQELLNDLVILFKEEHKRDLMRTETPTIEDRLDRLYHVITNMSRSLNISNETLTTVSLFMEYIDSSLSILPSLNMSTNNVRDSIKDGVKESFQISNAIDGTKNILNNLKLDRITNIDIPSNQSISYDELQARFQSVKSVLSLAENVTRKLIQDVHVLDGQITKADETLTVVNETLTLFRKVREMRDKLHTQVDAINSTKLLVDSMLVPVEEYVSDINKKIHYIKVKYSAYGYNSTSTEKEAKRIHNILTELRLSFLEASSELDLSNDDLRNITSTLYQPEDDEYAFNKTLHDIQFKLITTLSRITQVNNTLADISTNIPYTSVSLGMLDMEVKDINRTLVSEDSKSQFMNKTLPLLEEKYRRINLTIEMANVTLGIMHEQIEQLNSYVTHMKNRLNTFPTINISLTNIDDNITIMEGRLEIMKDYYNNVKEIVVNFQAELTSNNIIGNNISLDDVHIKYNQFNDTLEMVDTVLSKLDFDFGKMEDQFNYINDTLVDVGDALNTFEKKDIRIQSLNKDLIGVNNSLHNTNVSLSELVLNLDMLIERFSNMQEQYANVTDSTEEESARMKQQLMSMNHTLRLITNTMGHLFDRYDDKSNAFEVMNATLFQPLNTIDDLSSALIDVKQRFRHIKSSFVNLTSAGSAANTDIAGANSSLNIITNSLNNLNETLHYEQQKLNYVNNNVGPLEQRFNELLAPFSETNSTLITVKHSLENAASKMNNLLDALPLYPTMNISYSEQNESLQRMKEQAEYVTDNYLSIKHAFNSLRKNVTALTDRSGDLPGILAHYKTVNNTLDKLKDNLADMLHTLQNITSNTSHIQEDVSFLNSSLADYSRVNIRFSGVEENATHFGKDMKNSSIAIKRLNNTLNYLYDEISDMIIYYGNITKPNLKKTLNDTLREIQTKLWKVEKLSNALDKVKERHHMTLIDLTQVKELLNSTINNQDELNRIIHEANNIISDIARSAQKNHLNTTQIHENYISVQIGVSPLMDAIRQLNDSLYEEKSKQDFIKKNYPKLNKIYDAAKGTLSSSNSSINDIYDELSMLSMDMDSLRNRLNQIEPVYISLEAENNTSQEIKVELQNVTEKLKTVYDMLTKHNIDSLNDSRGSFTEVRATYSNFTTLMTETDSLLNDISNRIWKVSAKIGPLNTILNNVNKTVNRFLKVKSTILSVDDEGDDIRLDNNNIADIIQNVSRRFETYNISLQDVLTNFSHINDTYIIMTRDIVIKRLNDIAHRINNLNASTGEVREIADLAIAELRNIDMTFHANASNINDLLSHIRDVNDTAENIRIRFGKVDEKQNDINNASSQLTPEIKQLLNHIENLTKSYIDEQRKLDFIANNKFDLVAMFLNESENLNTTKRRISDTGINLVAMKENIAKTGDRLNKFKTLAITTVKEMETWDELKINQLTALAQFTNITKQYDQLLNDVTKLDNRNKTLDEMRQDYVDLRTHIIYIGENIKSINGNLDKVGLTIVETSGTLKHLTTSMDRFKEVQQDSRKTKKTLKNADKKLEDTSDKLSLISEKVKDTNNTFMSMIQHYKPIEDTEWTNTIPQIKRSLLLHNSTVDQSNNTVNELYSKIEKVRHSVTSMEYELANNVILRHNITHALDLFEKTLQDDSNLVSSVADPTIDIDTVLSNEKRYLDKLQLQLSEFNDSLHSELSKQAYVNKTLPLLQLSHVFANKSHVVNNGAVDEMNSILASTMNVLNKIKEKMNIFGLDDADNSVREWTSAVNKLNQTATALAKQHVRNGEILQNLANKLWKPVTEMYTDTETLKMVQDRLTLYNTALNLLNATSKNITTLFGETVAGTRDVIAQLIERDTILTTTPPTTTPSGPPEWMSFTTTETGVIGRDKGQAVCSVTDMSHWNAMKIVRHAKDGRKQTVAVWVVGKGARKTITDRRIRVMRVKVQNGGKLQVNIRSLQCKDEATYYCSINSHHMWPLQSSLAVRTLPQDSLVPAFPTEVFEDKIANFSCSGSPGYPNGSMTWKIKHDNEKNFRDYNFYSAKSVVTERDCIRRETITVQNQFDMTWNNTRIRCYIKNTDYHAEGIIRLLPYDICNKAVQDGTIVHPYTPHKYIICGKELNVMQCPGNTCFDAAENNCVQCKKKHGSGDPCYNKPPYSYVPHETDCKKYYICMGPNRTLKRCSRGYFHPQVPGFCTLSFARSWCSRQSK